ncbi:sensor domain-containing phosphodiesterase [Antarcticirhabdus aurantiaca]|uniref:EAL domain-containing protein n=1 Tax=Antarcticirhabdus aurantiaca TaxID=2606717 RepID=A0ACD4NXX0_9HYPH|nr:EAL domain-containing protein [Antarcticirhabdus aurantiaca]WAJ31294.1 EAL domain-containing protein [Jeongeuplla avenae]
MHTHAATRSRDLKRVGALTALRALEERAQPSLDRLCALAGNIFGVPISFVSLIDADTQWVKAASGIAAARPMPRAQTFCDHTIAADGILVVPDAREDARFKHLPVVTDGVGIRFYAGAPVRAEPGLPVGAMCIVDLVPRELAPHEAALLERLAEVAAEEIRCGKEALDAADERKALEEARLASEQRDRDIEAQRQRMSRAESFGMSGSWEADLATGRLTWSEGLFRLLGLEPDCGIDPATAFRERVHPDDIHLLDRSIELVAEGQGFSHEIRIVTSDGAVRHLASHGDTMDGPDGRPAKMVGVLLDVTDQRRAHEEAREARAQLEAVLGSTTDCVLVVDRDWRVTYMNERCRSFIEAQRSLEVGDYFWDAYPEHRGTEFEIQYNKALQTGVPSKFEAYLPSHSAWVEIGAFPSPRGLSIFFRDITDQRLAREKLLHLAHHDPLTGLPNRTRFKAELRRRLATGGDAAVLLVDLDGFKDVNDTLGHHVGDQLLREVADRLRLAVGSEGSLARLGGDEFALATNAHADDEGVIACGERIVDCLRAPFSLEGQEVPLGASVGAAAARTVGTVAGELFKAADVALYRAKADGGAAVRLFEPAMLERVRARQSLKVDLAGALEHGEFALAYQPILDLASGRACAAEALLRWNHPVRGSVSPADFVPLAEETGSIVAIGEWVLKEACREALEWPPHTSVAVNVSPVQFRSGTLPLAVAAILVRSGLDPRRLELEITESVLLRDSEANLKVLHALKEIGVRIALDDFGTGFSSLSYLRSFPFDKLKLDRSFVSEIGCSPQSEAIVRAAGEMGRAMSMTTTAEGVETSEQLRWLLAHGWSQAQGYFIGRPSPAFEVRSHLRRPAQRPILQRAG